MAHRCTAAVAPLSRRRRVRRDPPPGALQRWCRRPKGFACASWALRLDDIVSRVMQCDCVERKRLRRTSNPECDLLEQVAEPSRRNRLGAANREPSTERIRVLHIAVANLACAQRTVSCLTKKALGEVCLNLEAVSSSVLAQSLLCGVFGRRARKKNDGERGCLLPAELVP